MIRASPVMPNVCLGACEPVLSLACGVSPELRSVLRARLSDSFVLEAPGRCLSDPRGPDGDDRRTPGGAGCAQGAGDCLRPGAGPTWPARAARGGVREHGSRTARVARLACRAWRDAGGDGGHGRVLEGAVGDPGGRV